MITLRWEGGYSNHPDDPGGPTMRGIIQREYDKFRREKGLSLRPVRQIEEDELRTIYRVNYWDEMQCESLPPGLDLCVFDAAVNSGVSRARAWENEIVSIPDVINKVKTYQGARLTFLQGLGRLWRVFGAGWQDRVYGIQAQAMSMAGQETHFATDPSEMHAGMKGERVIELQTRLRALGYPVGEVDGFYGEQLRRAVILFQDDNELLGFPGRWLSTYYPYLERAKPALPGRANVTHGDLEAKGDNPVIRLNLLQRVFGWIFGASVVSGVADGSSVLDSVNGAREALEPLQGLFAWAGSHAWVAVAVAAVALITLLRLMRRDHVQDYRDFTYQGASSANLAH